MDERPGLTPLSVRKALGQHFLFDPGILQRTALAAGPVAGRTVIEVGPGPGGLTRALLDEGAGHVLAIEADNRFAGALAAWPEASAGRLGIIEGDARKIDLEAELASRALETPAMIIANLPYNVGTPLLVGWLKAGGWRGEMALMFQKEVALRICAQPGAPHYGRLAVLSQSVCDTQIALTLPPGAFHPPPKVDSAVAVLAPHPEPFDDLETLESVTAAAFGQRRKMLRTSLKGVARACGLNAETWLESCGIDPTARAETVDIAGFQRLSRELVRTGR